MPTDLITQALKLLSLLLEGTPIELREAKAIAWFWMWWPIGRLILKHNGTPPEVIAQIEAQATPSKPGA